MTNIFAELSRRNVFRVAAAYVIVGWIVLQVAAIAAPAMNLPGWAVSFVLFVIIIGFPLIILATWAFEMTPQGVRRSAKGAATEAGSVRRMDVALLVVGLALVVASVVTSGRAPVDEPSVEASAPQEVVETLSDVAFPRLSIAVLPLNNLSDERELGWIADGLAEDITTRLGSSPQMRVTARNSAFAWKGTSPNVREVGEALQVRFVLEGSIRKIGDRLRVTAQLIETGTGNHVWTDNYDHPLLDLGRMQDDVVDAISAEVQSAVYTAEYADLVRKDTDDLNADEAVVLAQLIMAFDVTSQRQMEAAGWLARVLKDDPGNAPAHATKAMLHAFVSLFATEAAQRSKQRELADYHLEEAVQTAPNDLIVLAQSASATMLLGKPDLCLSLAARMIELNSKEPIVWLVSANCRLRLGHYKETLEDLAIWKGLAGTRATERDGAIATEAEAHMGLGNWAEAIALSREGAGFSPLPTHKINLIVSLVHHGDIEEAQSLTAAAGSPNPDGSNSHVAWRRQTYLGEGFADIYKESLEKADFSVFILQPQFAEPSQQQELDRSE